MTARGTAPRAVMLGMALLVALIAGCASTPRGVSDYDPIQPFNRKMYNFNDALDRHVLKPVADAYIRVTPQPVRTSVANFFNNIAYPNVIVNDFLQGKAVEGFSDTGRFVVNSTFGVAGLFDPATHMGLASHNEDLGQTLAVWGTPQGAYLVLPFFGPNTVRNSPNLVLATVTDLLFYVSNPAVTIPLSVLGVVNTRAQASKSLEVVRQAALDPYIFVREGYLQRREYLIFDGHPPQKFYEEFDGGGVPPPSPGQSPAPAPTPAPVPAP